MAASHIAKNSCIYLDAGTTTLALARRSSTGTISRVTNDFEITQLLIDASQCGGSTPAALCAGRTAPAWANRRVRYATAIDTAFISRQRLGQSRDITPDENKVTVKETVSQVSARSILLCDSSKYNQVATFMALPLTRFHHHHYRPASFRCRRQSYRPARLRGAAGRITRAATAGLALPVLDQRRADPGDLLISLGHARRRIPQINHHNALCFVIIRGQAGRQSRAHPAC